MMRLSLGCWLVALAFPFAPSSLAAQDLPENAALVPFVPRRPETKQELDRLEALRLYARGLLCERNNHLIEAVKAFERALQLDPEGAPVCKSLVHLYLALDRAEDALAICRKALELDPGDYDTWQLLARQLRAQNRTREAGEAMKKALASPGLKEHPDQMVQLWFELGLFYESIQDYPQAEASLRQAAALLENPQPLLEHSRITREEIDLQAAETYERLGRVCLKAKNLDQAVAAFQKAQTKDPSRASLLSLSLAEVFLTQGKRIEALKCLDMYLETQPQGTEAYETKVKVMRDLGRQEEIIPTLQRYLARDRHNLGLRLLVAREYHLAGQNAQAEQEYTKLLAESPSAEVYTGLFEMLKKQGRPGLDKVLTRLNDSLKKASPDKEDEDAAGNPAEAAKARAMLLVLRNDPELVKGLMPLVMDRLLVPEGLARGARYFFAVLAARTKQLDAAEKLYRSCLPRVEGLPRSPEAHIYGGLLEVLWQAHKYDAVIEISQQGLAKAQATNRTMFHHNLARAHAQLGKMDLALEQADQAVKVARDDDLIRCRSLKARLLSEAGKQDLALAECQTMLKECKNAGEVRDARYALSSVYSHAKNYLKAEEQLQLILQVDPTDATACNDLGYIWADQGKNLEEAEKLIRKSLDLDRKQRTTGTSLDPDSDQDNAAYVDSLGWALFRRGQVDAARKELERAARMPTGAEDPVVWDHLGDVYFRLNDRAKAKSAWQKSIELYEAARRRPSDERYKEIKQKLKLIK